MRKPLDKPDAPTRGCGEIRGDAAYTWREACRRLGWCKKSASDAQRAGLRTILFGRQKHVLGRDVLAFFERLAERAEGGGQ